MLFPVLQGAQVHANQFRERLILAASRMVRTSGAASSAVFAPRTGLPAICRFISRTPLTSWAKCCLSILDILHQLCQRLDLLARQISLRTLNMPDKDHCSNYTRRAYRVQLRGKFWAFGRDWRESQGLAGVLGGIPEIIDNPERHDWRAFPAYLTFKGEWVMPVPLTLRPRRAEQVPSACRWMCAS